MVAMASLELMLHGAATDGVTPVFPEKTDVFLVGKVVTFFLAV